MQTDTPVEVKRCPKCEEAKPLTAFAKNASRRDGLQSACRGCRGSYYAADPERYKLMIKASQKKRRRARRQYVWDYLIEHPCVDCGENDPIVLDFDHVRGEKVKGIADILAQDHPMSMLLSEIEKCDIRCANCHRRRTAEQFGWYAGLTDPAARARLDGHQALNLA